MKKNWKVGIVYDTENEGLGNHGTHLAFTGLPNVEIVLGDSNVNGLDTRMKEIGAVKHYSDYREMLAKEKPDIACLCSRLPGDHFEQIKAAVSCGCHILCEKPLTASLEEADEIKAMSEKYKIKIAVAHLARYALVFRTLKKMVEQGEIGRPLTFYGRGKEDERGGGEDMMVLGTHILDLGAYFFGKPEYVFADVRSDGNPISRSDRNKTKEPVGPCAGDSILANFKFANGVNGVFESRKGLYRETVRMGITVVGTDGVLSVRYDDERKLRISRSQLPPEDEANFDEVELKEDRNLPVNTGPLPAGMPYFAENNRFAALDLMQAIEENRQPDANIFDVVNVLEMIYGVYSSSLEQKAISLPLTDRWHPLD